MQLKINLFEQITQHFYEDGNDIHWWIDEEDEADFLETHSDWLEDGSLKKTDTRVLSGKAWNDWWIGGTYGDYEGTFSDQECPNCEHLMVNSELEIEETGEDVKVQFCSNHNSSCGYVNEEYRRVLKLNNEYEKVETPEPPKFRIEGESLLDFCKRTKIDLERRKDAYFKDDTHYNICTVCKNHVPVNDYYISFGYAIVCYKHDNCSNGGPSVLVPFTKKEQDKWSGLLFGK